MDNNKTALRKEMLLLRKAVPCKKLTPDHLSHFSEFVCAKTVFCYVSLPGETDTLSFLEEILDKKTVVVPCCTDNNGNMICVKIHSLSDLEKGFFGVFEPKEKIPFPKEEIDIAIVPGLAFDKDGYRLGYGKGYYDRFLSGTDIFKVGICQTEFFVRSLPHDKYDVKMDDVVVV